MTRSTGSSAREKADIPRQLDQQDYHRVSTRWDKKGEVYCAVSCFCMACGPMCSRPLTLQVMFLCSHVPEILVHVL